MGLAPWAWIVVLGLGRAWADSGAATTGDSGLDPATDVDGDGWSLGEGDCDDADPAVNPGQPDVCFDEIDNDCSSLADEGCDNSARLGSLGGGGACTGGANIAGTATAVLAPLFVLVRRRRGVR